MLPYGILQGNRLFFIWWKRLQNVSFLTNLRVFCFFFRRQEKFRSLTSSYYRGTHGIVVVYDVTNRESFSHLETWLNEIATYTSADDCVMLLVGNKIDLEARAVSREEGQKFARDRAMVFIETSAKTREGIKHTFEELVQKVLDNPRLEAETRPKDKSNIIKQVIPPSDSSSGDGEGDNGCMSC